MRPSKIDNQGMALLITIITLSILVVVTIQFQKNIWGNYQQSHLHKENLQLSKAAKSGINIAQYILTQQDSKKPNIDSAFSLWATIDEVPFETLFPETKLNISITDGESKLPVNFLANTQGNPDDQKKVELYRESLHRILISDSFQLEAEDSRALVDAITDWIDSNDTVLPDGAEDDYYQSLETPYTVRNSPIKDLSDLLPVRGMTKELLYGSPEIEALADYLTTTNSTGLININTATPEVLRYIFPQLTNTLLENIVEFRENPDNTGELNSPEWYKKITNWPPDIVLAEHILTVTSSGFTITARASQETRNVTISATAHRTASGNIQLNNRRIIY